MLGLIFPFVVGLLLGVPMVMRYSRFRDRSIAYRIGMGLLVSFGIGITINASQEILELFGHSTDGSAVAVTGRDADAIAVPESQLKSDSRDHPKIWTQEQKFPDGTLSATRTVTLDSSGEIVPHGPAATYHPNGQVKWTGKFELGRQVVGWQEYYPDGTKEGERMIADDGDAEEKHWHQNGQPKSAGTWRAGAKHGGWKTWYTSGQLAGEYLYANGLLHGDVRAWHVNGKPKLEATYSRGQLIVLSNRWNEQGELIAGPAMKVTESPDSTLRDSG